MGIIVVVAIATTTAASASVVNTNSATCGPGAEQPRCNDPSSHVRGRTIVDGEQHQPMAAASRTNTSIRDDSSKDKAFCDASGYGTEEIRHEQQRLRSGAPFKTGDVIELYNTESHDIQIVFPSLVRGRERGAPGGYRITKTTDGTEVKNIPEKHMHMYVPYQKGDEALCNIGEYKPARPKIVRCTVIDYEPAASRGAMVLQGNYSVQIHATRANDEYRTQLPVWKMQRRYLNSA